MTTLEQILSILSNSKTGGQLPVSTTFGDLDFFIIYNPTSGRIEKAQKSTAQGTFLTTGNNLSDVQDVSVSRTNLEVYSVNEVIETSFDSATKVSSSLTGITNEYDLNKEICNIERANDSIRENCVFYYPPNGNYYLLCDIIPDSSPYFPNSYDTEIGLYKSTDLENWTYLGIAIEKGGVGELAEFGVASCSGAAYFNGKIYAPFSARNNGAPNFNNRSIGLAFTSEPESLPWSKVSTAILNTSGEDDDPCIMTIPSDDYLHCYWRTTESNLYKIVHSKTKTPEVVSSWSTPNDSTQPINGVAQELSSCAYFDGRIQMYVMQQGGGQTGTSHLVSYDADGLFTQAFADNKFFNNIDNIIYNGHITPIVKDYIVLGWTWTVSQNDSGKYGLLGYRVKDVNTDITEALFSEYYDKSPSLSFDGTNRVEIPVDTQYQISANEDFTWHFKIRLDKDRVLDASTDQNAVFSLGDNEAGAIIVNLRGGSIYQGCFFRFYTGVGAFIDVLPLEDVSHYFLGAENATISVTRNGTTGNFILYINGNLIVNSPQDSTIAFANAKGVFGAIGNQVVPFHGQIYESVLLNVEQTESEIRSYHYSAKIADYDYVQNGSGTGILLHYRFNVFSKFFEDLGTEKIVSETINYAESQHVNLVKPYKVETVPVDSTATNVAGLVADFNNLLQTLRDSQFFN